MDISLLPSHAKVSLMTWLCQGDLVTFIQKARTPGMATISLLLTFSPNNIRKTTIKFDECWKVVDYKCTSFGAFLVFNTCGLGKIFLKHFLLFKEKGFTIYVYVTEQSLR